MTRSLATLAVVLLAFAPPGAASWGVSASGTGAAKAKTMSGGNIPGASAAGNNVTVTWAASTFPEGGSIPTYIVKRYNLLGTDQTVLGGCAGTVSGTSCTENGVPIGTWRYTVTPAVGQWRGAESAQSANVVVLV